MNMGYVRGRGHEPEISLVSYLHLTALSAGRLPSTAMRTFILDRERKEILELANPVTQNLSWAAVKSQGQSQRPVCTPVKDQ